MPYEWLKIVGDDSDLPEGNGPIAVLDMDARTLTFLDDMEIKAGQGQGLVIGPTGGSLGAVTQASSISTAVEVNALAGAITTVDPALGAGAEAAFTVTNNKVAAGDVIALSVVSGPGDNEHVIASVTAVAAGSFQICLTNLGASQADGAMVINFAVIKTGLGV